MLLMLVRKISVTTEPSSPIPLTNGSCNLSDVNHTETLGNGTQGLMSVTRCSASRLAQPSVFSHIGGPQSERSIFSASNRFPPAFPLPREVLVQQWSGPHIAVA